MEFGLLGPLEARHGERVVPVGGAKQRALLAILLLHANEVVSRDRLLDELWPERPPGDADHSLDHQVSRLRKALGDPELVRTRAGGYVLELEPEQLDANRFERLLEEGRRANAGGDPARALTRLEEGLALWRGGALADLAYEPFARAEIDRLEELRLLAIEERIDAELSLGRHAALTPELESLAAKHPLRERLRGQQMLALYRSGRQAEALRVFADARRALVAELGLEPGAPLRELEQAILRQDASLDPAPPAAARLRRRRGALVAVALLGAAGAAAAGVVLAAGGTQSSQALSQAEPESLVLLSARSGRIDAQASVRAPVLSRFGEGALWNLSFDGELTKLDPKTGKIEAFGNAGVPIPCGLAVAGGSVWVTDCTSSTLVRIEPARAIVVDRIKLPPTCCGPNDTGEVAYGAGSLWVAQGFANPSFVDRIDPGTGRLEKRITIPRGGANGGLTFGDGAVWVAGNVDAPEVPKLSKIDPATNRVVATVPALAGQASGVAVGGGFVWAGARDGLWKIGETGEIVARIPLAPHPETVAYAAGAAWVADGEAGTVVRIDATTNAKRTYRLGHDLNGLAVDGDRVAVGVQPDAADVTAGLKGRVATIALKEDDLDASSTDPAGMQGFNRYQQQFHYATCARLYDYPDAPGAAGARLQPEVAAGWPSVSDGGRTVRIRVRGGYRFSPPSGAPVTAETFRHEFERVLSPNVGGPWALWTYGNVAGSAAYHAGRTAHISGVSVEGDTLVIRLLRPDADLPRFLARAALCAVPDGTPMIDGGLPGPLPSAGPYYLAARSSDAVVLKRNPNYHGPRPHAVDAIVYRLGVPLGTALAQLARGEVDYVEEEDDPLIFPASAAARAAGTRYRLTPKDSTAGLALNTRRPLFSDPRLRLAVAYAIDRRALAAAAGGPDGIPTSSVAPPSRPGSVPVFSLRPDRARARALAGERHTRAVLAAPTDENGHLYETKVIALLRRELGAIGIELSVLPFTQQLIGTPQYAALLARADLALTGADDTSDPVAYLRQLGEQYLPAGDRERLDRIDRLAPPERDRAADALALKLEREAVYVQYLSRGLAELVSKRLGCVIDHPEYPGLDLAAVCMPG